MNSPNSICSQGQLPDNYPLETGSSIGTVNEIPSLACSEISRDKILALRCGKNSISHEPETVASNSSSSPTVQQDPALTAQQSTTGRFDTNGLQTRLGQPDRLIAGGNLHAQIVEQKLDYAYVYRITDADPENPANPRTFSDSNSVELTISQNRKTIQVNVPYNVSPEFSDKMLDFLKKRGADIQNVTSLEQGQRYSFNVTPAISPDTNVVEVASSNSVVRSRFNGAGFPQSAEEGPVKLNQKDPITIERVTKPGDVVQEFRIVGKGNGKYDDFFNSYADLKMVDGKFVVTFQNQFPGNTPNPQFVRDVCNELARRGLEITPNLTSMKQFYNLNGESMGYRLMTQTRP